MTKDQNAVGWFEIYVQDMNRAQAFYEATFDLKLQALPTAGIRMLAFPMKPELRGCSGALVKMDGKDSGGGGTIVYFSCTDCAIEVARAIKQGGSVFKDKFSIGQHGFIALIFDTEENMIGLHSLQ